MARGVCCDICMLLYRSCFLYLSCSCMYVVGFVCSCILLVGLWFCLLRDGMTGAPVLSLTSCKRFGRVSKLPIIHHSTGPV